jgi:ATP-dependent protease ClpP protease subunit
MSEFPHRDRAAELVARMGGCPAADMLAGLSPAARAFLMGRPASGARPERMPRPRSGFPYRDRLYAEMERSEETDALEQARSRHALAIGVIGGVGRDFADASGRYASAHEIAQRLRRDTLAPVALHINSHGGSFLEAKRIYEELRSRNSQVVAMIGPNCKSAAGIVTCGADFRVATPKSRFLLHPVAMDPQSLAGRLDASRLRRLAELVDADSEEMVRMYQRHCGAPADRFRDLIASKVELGPMAARQLGIITSIELPGEGDGEPAWRI